MVVFSLEWSSFWNGQVLSCRIILPHRAVASSKEIPVLFPLLTVGCLETSHCPSAFFANGRGFFWNGRIGMVGFSCECSGRLSQWSRCLLTWSRWLLTWSELGLLPSQRLDETDSRLMCKCDGLMYWSRSLVNGRVDSDFVLCKIEVRESRALSEEGAGTRLIQKLQ
ncbi:hypothetical protein AUEXF2481DRAFT_327426 [Aureobasidium subglaciale EXF-2481]|uniref:Uncharacterized protein n=1 Tax=Aureobasidium subglaciale (strain EXF-2481) TaxID=1043005 RepID=A0A074Z3I5_AURSE|nr:uncharacterized protein AUEXF2481DRAFT_327426 [Aureobasidium subglaciale EXF-2481]KEQ93581.1 hypothetical protein AUEXF2481DRAFT_327426 [Aureobasidium subglaciale EXF-2481]